MKVQLWSVEKKMIAHPIRGTAVSQNDIWAMQGAHTSLEVTRTSRELNAVCFPSRRSYFHWISNSPFLPGTWVPLGIVSLFHINWIVVGCLLLFCQNGVMTRCDSLGLPWQGPGASSRPVCVLVTLPSAPTCLWDSRRAASMGEAEYRREASPETSLAIWSLSCASKPFMFHLPSKKKESLI